MASTIQSFRYAVDASFLLGSTKSQILTESIQNVICKYDYETKHMPIVYVGLKLQDYIYDMMVKNIDTGFIVLTVYKYSNEDTRISQKEVYFRKTFSYFMPQDMTYNEKKILNSELLESEKERAYRVCILGLFDMDIVNKNGVYTNQLFRDSDMQSIIHYCTSHINNFIVEPFKDNEKLDFCFVPPNLTVNKMLHYLNSVHSFYDTGYRYFNDFNHSYLLSNKGNAVGASTENFDTIIVRIMDTDEYNTKLLSMEIDRTQNAYIMYIDRQYVNISIDHMKDKQYHKIIGTDTLGNTVEKDLNIPTNEEGTEKIKLSRLYNGNLDYINTIKDAIENNSVVINIVKGEIDTTILTPNKEYLVRNYSSFKEYDGRYMLAYKREVLVKQSTDFISNTIFGLRKIMDDE